MSSELSVLAVIETSAGVAREACFELLSAARDLDPGVVTALVIGNDVAAVGERAAQGADAVLVAEHEIFHRYSTNSYVAAIEAGIGSTGADVVLIAGTTSGRDLAPYLAARHGREPLTDCIKIFARDGRLIGTRPVFQGKMISDVSIPVESPAFIVVRSGAYPQPSQEGQGDVKPLEVKVDAIEMPVEFIGLTQAKGGDTHLEDADIVVVGGRGVGSAEQYQIILDLADALGGVAGATRAVTDLGWRPHHEQIGQTGANVRPRLYIGVGVSGAVQHAVGMQNSETIVAINRDPDAPLFRMAEIGVVGDLHEILPYLISEIRSAKGS
jgi:electron transfer flavoprotein alpha subunit